MTAPLRPQSHDKCAVGCEPCGVCCQRFKGHEGRHRWNGHFWEGTNCLSPQSAEQPRFQVNELIKDEAVWKACRWEVSDKHSIAWKAICRTKDDAQEIANALEAYARAARDEALPVRQLEEDSTWRGLPIGYWFVLHSPNCVDRYSVQKRTSSGCTLVCSTPWHHESARHDMQEIAEAHNAKMAAVRVGESRCKNCGRETAKSQSGVLVHKDGGQKCFKSPPVAELGVGESSAAAPAAPLLCRTCGAILDPNWLNCPKCEGKARSTPVEKSALDTTTNEV